MLFYGVKFLKDIYTMVKIKLNKFSLIFALFISAFIFTAPVAAQFTTDILSGNNPESYVCPGDNPSIPVEDENGKCTDPAANGVCRTRPKLDSATGYFVCNVDGQTLRATLKAPPLQQLEVWFRRILYAIWVIVGTFSFVMLVYLGYRYMIQGGTSDQELVKLRKSIINYIVGFALVFLAIPILTTFFTLLGINKKVACYDVAMPGFQFFFPELCTDPRNTIVSDPCTYGGEATGYACPVVGVVAPTCTVKFSDNLIYEFNYTCKSTEAGSTSGAGTWEITGKFEIKL